MNCHYIEACLYYLMKDSTELPELLEMFAILPHDALLANIVPETIFNSWEDWSILANTTP